MKVRVNRTVSLTYIFFQVQRRIVHQRLHHSHQVDQQSQVVLRHVHLYLQNQSILTCPQGVHRDRTIDWSLTALSALWRCIVPLKNTTQLKTEIDEKVENVMCSEYANEAITIHELLYMQSLYAKPFNTQKISQKYSLSSHNPHFRQWGCGLEIARSKLLSPLLHFAKPGCAMWRCTAGLQCQSVSQEHIVHKRTLQKMCAREMCKTHVRNIHCV